MKLTDLELEKLANNIQELLYSASDICHDRSVKFLMARAKVRSLAHPAVARISIHNKKTSKIYLLFFFNIEQYFFFGRL